MGYLVNPYAAYANGAMVSKLDTTNNKQTNKQTNKLKTLTNGVNLKLTTVFWMENHCFLHVDI